MDRLKERIAFADKALTTLESVLREPAKSTVWRDACVKRFEYSFETTWKAAQRYLALQGTELASPKPVIRACFQAGLLDESQAEAALRMVEDRNLAAHTYDERLAESSFPDFRPMQGCCGSGSIDLLAPRDGNVSTAAAFV